MALMISLSKCQCILPGIRRLMPHLIVLCESLNHRANCMSASGSCDARLHPWQHLLPLCACLHACGLLEELACIFCCNDGRVRTATPRHVRMLCGCSCARERVLRVKRPHQGILTHCPSSHLANPAALHSSGVVQDLTGQIMTFA